MAIVRRDFILTSGQKFPVAGDAGSFTWESGGAVVDLTGYTALLKVRGYPDATTSLLSLTDGSGITLGGTAGTIDIAFTAVQTEALGPGFFPYDLVLTPSTGAADAVVFLSGYLRIEQLMSRSG